MKFARSKALDLCLLLALGSQPCIGATLPSQPELSSQWANKAGWAAKTYAIAAANPHAAKAGQDILKAGGSAIDAAVAAQMVLTLVEPQSSGIGGGAFLLHFDGNSTQAFDGRETAPAEVTPTLFLSADGRPMPLKSAAVGGRAVGVPGVLPMLYAAHKRHGKLAWNALFKPAIQLARKGFNVSPRMASLLASEKYLSLDPVARGYFFDAKGQPWPAGHLLRNPELAAILEEIARHGPSAFMQGAVAQAIVRKVREHPTNPGLMSASDLQTYQPVVRAPLCFDYAVEVTSNVYSICGMPPPSSGQLAIGQILGILGNAGATSLPLVNGLPTAAWLHLYTEASRLAFADRSQFVADPDFAPAPGDNWNSLLEPGYLRSRTQLIDTGAQGKAMIEALPGNPGEQKIVFAPMPQQHESGTSHISIIDSYGNALAMTTSIEDGWGARQMVNRGLGLKGGFLLNNQLTDFSFAPVGPNGLPIANRVESGKRPRSAMSPTLIFDKSTGKLVMTAGSPGGALIIHFVAKTIFSALNWQMNVQKAIDLPNFGSLGGPLLLESGRFDAATIEELRARNHRVIELDLPSGLQAIQRTPTGLFGGADPRREGTVLGD